LHYSVDLNKLNDDDDDDDDDLAAIATHFPLLSYRFDTSTRIFHQPQNVRFPKMYDNHPL